MVGLNGSRMSGGESMGAFRGQSVQVGSLLIYRPVEDPEVLRTASVPGLTATSTGSRRSDCCSMRTVTGARGVATWVFGCRIGVGTGIGAAGVVGSNSGATAVLFVMGTGIGVVSRRSTVRVAGRVWLAVSVRE